MADKFQHCPRCGGIEFEDAGYEDEGGNDTEELRCSGCNWEGTPDQLVCKDDSE